MGIVKEPRELRATEKERDLAYLKCLKREIANVSPKKLTEAEKEEEAYFKSHGFWWEAELSVRSCLAFLVSHREALVAAEEERLLKDAGCPDSPRKRRSTARI